MDDATKFRTTFVALLVTAFGDPVRLTPRSSSVEARQGALLNLRGWLERLPATDATHQAFAAYRDADRDLRTAETPEDVPTDVVKRVRDATEALLGKLHYENGPRSTGAAVTPFATPAAATPTDNG